MVTNTYYLTTYVLDERRGVTPDITSPFDFIFEINYS